MKYKSLFGATLFLLLGWDVASAGDPWEGKPYTAWTKRDVLKVLTRSPWAQPQYPYSVSVEPGHITLWSSSLTVWQALLRMRQLEGKVASDQPQLRFEPPEHYVILVYRPDATRLREQDTLAYLPLFRQLNEEVVRKSAYLMGRKEKRKISPTKVEFTRGGPQVMLAVFYFPRNQDGRPTIGPEEKEVEFLFTVGMEVAGANFDLRKMVRDGKPDL
jgi:hypothetical protein